MFCMGECFDLDRPIKSLRGRGCRGAASVEPVVDKGCGDTALAHGAHSGAVLYPLRRVAALHSQLTILS